jgi:hypothetical protein
MTAAVAAAANGSGKTTRSCFAITLEELCTIVAHVRQNVALQVEQCISDTPSHSEQGERREVDDEEALVELGHMGDENLQNENGGSTLAELTW